MATKRKAGTSPRPRKERRQTETVKLWKPTVELINKYKRETPSDQKMPSTPQIVDLSVRRVIESSGHLPIAEDILTPAQRRILYKLAAFERSNEDPDFKAFVFKKLGISEDIRELHNMKTRAV